jgi:hypothetical protein
MNGFRGIQDIASESQSSSFVEVARLEARSRYDLELVIDYRRSTERSLPDRYKRRTCLNVHLRFPRRSAAPSHGLWRDSRYHLATRRRKHLVGYYTLLGRLQRYF